MWSWRSELEEHQRQSPTSYVSISDHYIQLSLTTNVSKRCTLDFFFLLNSYHKQLPWKLICITLLYILSISPLKFIFCQNLTFLWYCFLVFHSLVIILQSQGHCWWTAATLLINDRSENQGGLSSQSWFYSLVTRQSESSVISSTLWFQSRLVLLGRRPTRPLLAVHYHNDYYYYCCCCCILLLTWCIFLFCNDTNALLHCQLLYSVAAQTFVAILNLLNKHGGASWCRFTRGHAELWGQRRRLPRHTVTHCDKTLRVHTFTRWNTQTVENTNEKCSVVPLATRCR